MGNRASAHREKNPVKHAAIAVALLAMVAAFATAQNNPRGVMTRHSAGYDSDWVTFHLGKAHEMSGDWGYTRTGYSKRNIIMHRAQKLIPICSVGTDESPASVASKVSEAISGGFKIPYIEIGNEPQGGHTAADYAAHCLAVIDAVKAVDPSVQVMNGGFAGTGAGYLEDMFIAEPRLITDLDIVCCHPYPINRPPSEPGGFVGYLDTVAVMDAYGFTGPIAFTEFGYELGNHSDPAWPEITEENRATYMVEIFDQIVANDPRILAACPFMLSDELWNGWADFDFIRFDRSETPQFQALAALAKPQGSDWMPQGAQSVSGQVLDPALSGVDRAYVYLEPGLYADLTDADGNYSIENVPAGVYQLYAFRHGYVDSGPVAVDLSAGAKSAVDARLVRRGNFRSGFDSGTSAASGWTTGEAHLCTVDYGVKYNGAASQRITAAGPGGGVMLWRASNYNSIFTGEVWTAQVWVKSYLVSAGAGRGPYLQIDFRDNYFDYVATASVSMGDVGTLDEWTPLSMSFVIPDNGRRMQVMVGMEADSGLVWFDDIIVDRADRPFPQWRDSDAFVAGWNMMSAAMRPADPDAEAAFDKLERVGNYMETNLFSFSSDSGYAVYSTDFQDVCVGTGYWLRLSTGYAETMEGQPMRGDFTIPLSGWTLVGHPYLTAQLWEDCLIDDGVTQTRVGDAEGLGLIQTTAYYYDSSGYKELGVAKADDTHLRPWRAYWVLAYQPGLSLVIPDPYGSGTLSGTVQDTYAHVVENATIDITPWNLAAVTDALGDYSAADIPAGLYTVRFSAPDYLTAEFTGVEVLDGGTTDLDIVLLMDDFPTDVQNGDFETTGGESVPGWTRFGEVDGIQSDGWYAAITGHSPTHFLGTAANWGAKDGGVYQRVQLPPETNHVFKGWYCVYWTGGTSVERGCRIGVDPYGGTDPSSPSVEWSDWGYENSEGVWTWRYLYTPIFTTVQGYPLVTVFLEHFQRPGGVWNITCFDDVELISQ